jgi:8-hydroxy-5-deazaflavin:NADPH oxidoreductase
MKGHMYFAQETNRPDPKLTVPIAGNDPEVVRAVGLVDDAGFDPVIIGKLIDAKLFQRGPPAAARG